MSKGEQTLCSSEVAPVPPLLRTDKLLQRLLKVHSDVESKPQPDAPKKKRASRKDIEKKVNIEEPKFTPIPEPKYPSWHTRLKIILIETANRHGIFPDDLIDKSRVKHLVLARQEFFYRALSETQTSVSRIGRFVARDHTTIAHGAGLYCRRNGLPLVRACSWRASHYAKYHRDLVSP